MSRVQNQMMTRRALQRRLYQPMSMSSQFRYLLTYLLTYLLDNMSLTYSVLI